MKQQQSLGNSITSPQCINNQTSLISSSITNYHTSKIQEDLILEHKLFQKQHNQPSLLNTISHLFNQFTHYSLIVFTQLWKQIIPSKIRGELPSAQLIDSENNDGSEKVLFEEYKCKKCRFFLIVFNQNCEEEAMQEAYQKASFIEVQGRGIRATQMMKQTNCKNWRIKNWQPVNHFSILFFRIDLFGSLLHFGTLTKELIDTFREEENFLQNYKSQLNEAYEGYQLIEKEFISSYLQKDERLQFE